MSSWIVRMAPIQKNDKHGVSVMLVNLSTREEREVSRVGYWRRKDVVANPDASFEEQLRKEIEKAEMAAQVVNDYQAESEAKERELSRKARAKLDEILGPVRSEYE